MTPTLFWFWVLAGLNVAQLVVIIHLIERGNDQRREIHYLRTRDREE